MPETPEVDPERLKPKPAHERTLERILLAASRGFSSVEDTTELAVLTEIHARVVGVALPTPRKTAPNSLVAEVGPYEYNLAIPTAIVAALEQLVSQCRMQDSVNLVREAIAWVREEYLDNPAYAHKYPAEPTTEPAQTPEA